MELEILKLKSLRPLKLGDSFLNSSFKRLAAITENLPPPGSISSPELEKVRQKVRFGFRRGLPFESYTDFPRRESALLHLYFKDLSEEEDREQIPKFDQSVASSLLLGKKSKVRRDQATAIFLTHFGEERLPCLAWLADWLRSAWKSEYFERQGGPISPYITEAEMLFCLEAPEKVAQIKNQNESVDQLSLRLKIPDISEFKERLFEEIVLQRLRAASLSGIDADLQNLVVESKTKILRNGYALGAEAVKILISRTIKEFGSDFPSAWREQIVQFSCDPRLLNKSEHGKWWGWATEQQKNVAKKALDKWTLEEFIDLLKTSLSGDKDTEAQFEHRAGFLLRLLRLDKVLDAKLIIHNEIYRTLDRKTTDFLQPSRLASSGTRTSGTKGIKLSLICLKCVDDIFIIEGTHSFGLRVFIGPKSFPIRSFWERGPAEYKENLLRVDKSLCSIYERHDREGRWIGRFLDKLRRHPSKPEWRGLNVYH